MERSEPKPSDRVYCSLSSFCTGPLSISAGLSPPSQSTGEREKVGKRERDEERGGRREREKKEGRSEGEGGREREKGK